MMTQPNRPLVPIKAETPTLAESNQKGPKTAKIGDNHMLVNSITVTYSTKGE